MTSKTTPRVVGVNNPRVVDEQGSKTVVSLSLRLKDLLGPETRVERKKKKSRGSNLDRECAGGVVDEQDVFAFEVRVDDVLRMHVCDGLLRCEGFRYGV